MPFPFSPLHAQHVALGAKIVPFGGWEMPLSYPEGTLAEHRACRSHAVVFDVSHLGTVRVTGPGAFETLQHAFTNDLGRIAPGRAQYTHLLDDADGSVLDDIIVWWVDDENFDVMPNASNIAGVLHALREGTPQGGAAVNFVDVTAHRAILAIQGPEARRLLAEVWPEAAAVPRFAVANLDWNDIACHVAGTGYTGEDGVEIAIPADAATDLWLALLSAGILPAGLGARDTLRLEAGLPLHGHELGPGITPLQAGLGWVVAWNKPDFRGRKALEAERITGVGRQLRGIVVEGRRPPRAGQNVLRGEVVVGELTSGNFSPLLESGIALGFLAPDIEVGDEVEIDQRGTRVPGRVVKPPFVTLNK
ncbi:MAG: glycine cleavage system aminomethyltransferase GcvT [Acidimicrobiales bacterium]